MNKAEERFAKQLQFLRKLKEMKLGTLRTLHRKTFIRTIYRVKIPKWMHRSILERRLFYFFCLKNYHYPKGHPIAIEFKERAKHVLSKDYLHTINPEDVAKQALRDSENFTITAIRSMSINEVDRYLASLSLYVEADEDMRRKVLWEWFNKPAHDLPSHHNDRGIMVRPRRKGRVNNKYSLRDLILKHPLLNYLDFSEAYGKVMPTVSMASFHNARYLLRKAGYDIPRLPRGPSRPAVVTGPYGKPQKARALNDATLIGANENGQEEPW